MQTEPYAIGTRFKYDPSHTQDPHAVDCTISKVNDLGGGSYSYSVVTRDPRTARPVLPAIDNVASNDLFVPVTQPGPGNDL